MEQCGKMEDEKVERWSLNGPQYLLSSIPNLRPEQTDTGEEIVTLLQKSDINVNIFLLVWEQDSLPLWNVNQLPSF